MLLHYQKIYAKVGHSKIANLLNTVTIKTRPLNYKNWDTQAHVSKIKHLLFMEGEDNDHMMAISIQNDVTTSIDYSISAKNIRKGGVLLYQN